MEYYVGSLSPAPYHVFSSGNVGVGTTTPASLLSGTERIVEIANSNVASLYLDATGTGRKWSISSISDGTLTFWDLDAVTERMRITTAGNVLIGTTSDAGYKLRVNGSSYFDSPILCYTGNGYITALTNDGVGSNNGFGYSFLINNNGHEIGRLTGIYETSGGGGSGGIGFWTRGSGTLSTKMILNSGGTLTLNSYGSGTKTGTAAYTLAVDSSGNIIETSGGGGGGGVHIAIPPRSGQGYGLITSPSTSPQTYSPGSNLLCWFPFIPSNNITIDRIIISVTSAAASGIAVFTIYSNTNGMPDRKLFASSNIDCSTTGYKSIATTQTFTAGTVYWFGLTFNNNSIGFAAHPPASSYSFAWLNSTGIPFAANNCVYFITTSPGSEPNTVDQSQVGFSFDNILNTIIRAA